MNVPETLLREIYDKPREETAWLVYADWLEEQGDPRAEYIRLHLELGRLSAQDSRLTELQHRRARLLEEHQAEWAPFLSHLQGRMALAP